MDAGALAATAGGAAVILVTLLDLFLTVFNYDGFTFIASRAQRLVWRILLAATAPLAAKLRAAARSLASASLLPATICWWLAGEITGFALIFWAGMGIGGFSLMHGLRPGAFEAGYCDPQRPTDKSTVRFRELQDRTRRAMGLPPPPDDDVNETYDPTSSGSSTTPACAPSLRGLGPTSGTPKRWLQVSPPNDRAPSSGWPLPAGPLMALKPTGRPSIGTCKRSTWARPRVCAWKG